MSLRRIQGSLVLGLIASLAAHWALFGREHLVGGGHHALIVGLAAVGSLTFIAGLCALSWMQSKSAADGSVIAARLRLWLPGFAEILASAGLWYGAIEAVEQHHPGVPLFALALALSAASSIVLWLARTVANAIAEIAFAIAAPSFAPRLPSWRRSSRSRIHVRSFFVTRRRFARPPPIVVAFSRA